MFYYTLLDWIWIFMVTVNVGPNRNGMKVDITLVYYNSKSIVLNLKLNKDKRQNILYF